MPRLLRTHWGKALALALIGVFGVTALSAAGNGIPLFPAAPAAAEGPRQATGSAEGRSHLVIDGTNRTTGRSLRARYPQRASAARKPAAGHNTARVAAPPAPKPGPGYDPASSREVVADRDAHSRTYLNTDGTETTEVSSTPVNYRSREGAWQPIESRLVPQGQGWANTADAVGTRIADHADAADLASVTLPTGETFGYSLEGASAARGSARSDRVTYAGVLPDTDLWLDSQAGGVKETLVLRSADAPTDFVFPLHTSGLTAHASADGAIALTDAGGRTRAVIPAGSMEDARRATSPAVRYALVPRDGGQALRVSVDRSWLADPARAFPVRVDPTVDTTSATDSMYVTGSGSVSGASELHVGKGPEGATAAYVGFPGLDDKLRNHRIFGAQLQVVDFDSASCKARPLSVHAVTAPWTATTGSSQQYPGPAVGPALASKSFAYGFIGFGASTSACPAAGELFDLGKAGRDLVQQWADGSRPDYGLSLRASATDPLGFKKLTGDATANPPKLFVTHSPYSASYAFTKPVPDPPVLQNQDGKVKVTVTNKGAETWTASTYYLAYRVYDAKGKLVSQQRSANLTGSVAHGAKVTLDATIKAMPPGSYMLDFTMVRTGGKVFTDEQVPPGRLVLQVFDIAPVPKELFPPNGYQAQTLSPQLWASGVDIDAPSGLSLQYKFEICESDKDGNATACTTSAYQTSTAYAVPAGRLSWGRTYLWRAFIKDASNEVPTDRSAIVADVPQPGITSHLADGQGQEYDPDTGNFTTAASDASVTGVGPALTLVRTYNSLDPRTDLGFGAGWSTRYDMRLTPDDDGTGNVVIRYPDGPDMRFGKNPDGSFAPPPGRFAKLTTDATAGTYRLQDKTGSTYDFSNSGLLTKITDPYSNAVTYTYSSGKITTAANARTHRSLTFTWTGAHITKVSTNPLNGTPLSWTYSYTGDRLDKVCDPAGGCTQYGYGAISHYRSAVLDARPESYWRLGEDDGTAAESAVDVNLGKDRGTYSAVTLGAAGGLAGDPGTAATFNGSTSRVDLPSGTLKKSRDAAVEVWFKTIATGVGGPLVGYQDKAYGTTPTTAAPLLYVGTDGKLRGQFWTGTAAPITDTTKNVNDGKWHHAVVSVAGSTQSLYLDGKLSGTLTGKQLTETALTYDQIGAARATTPSAWPGWGTAASKSFAGTIDDVAVYHHPLGAEEIADHFRIGGHTADVLTSTMLPSGRTASEVAYDTALDRIEEYTDRNGGTWEIGSPAVFGDDKDLRRTIEVHDPLDSPYFYEYDPLTSQMLRYGQPTAIGPRETPSPSPSGGDDPPGEICTKPDPGDPAFCTNPPGDGGGEPDFIRHPLDGVAIRTFTYDDRGFQTGVTNENGATVTLGYDDRGNVTSSTTCRAKGDCQTTYTTYPTPTGDLDLRADQPTETRDGRSSGPTDNRYRTQYTYNTSGALLTQTAPDGGVVRNTYTTGAEMAVDGGNVPTGLPLTGTDPRGKITRYRYFNSGDLAQITEPSGLVTKSTYDALGRKLTETTVSDSVPAGATTTYAYDVLSRVTTVTAPATTDVVSLAEHQQKTATAYDADGNVVRTEVSDAFGGDPSRTMSFDLDDHGRPRTVTDAEGNETSYTYDTLGNRTSMVDANGNHFDYLYTARNMIAETRLRDWDDDGGDDDRTVIESYAYDLAGRVARNTDSMGRSVLYDYYGDDLVKSVTLKDFHNPDGTKRDYVVESDTYDGAGNVLTETSGNGRLTTSYTYDPVGRTASTVTDPDGVARRTTWTYDLAGNVKSTSQSGLPSNVPVPVSVNAETVTYDYDDDGNAVTESVANGAQARTTHYTYDQRGLTTSMTDPGGRTTDYTYDELGRPLSTQAPAVTVESAGTAPTTSRPTTYTGYDTFGSATESVDALGRTNRSAYDRLGRLVTSTAPQYTAPGSTTPVTPTVTNAYDALGNVVSTTDPLGRVTTFRYDRENRMTERDEPTGTGDDRAVWRYTYTRTGEVLSVTDPTGARAESTYDDLDRPVTQTQFERTPQPGAFTTRDEYDDLGDLVRETAPGGGVTQYEYDSIGQLVRSVDPAGVVARMGYDIDGRQVRQTDGRGRTSLERYDGLGQLVEDADLDATNSQLRSVHYDYDQAGDLTTSTDSLGHATTFAYDALDRMTSQTEPVSDTTSITTSFGYDANGNRTRYTDGRGNSTFYTTNVLGLTESVIEPATQRDPSAAARTWTTAYDAAGQPVKTTEPGGVSRQQEFDNAGRLVHETGSGAEAATTDRTFGYDAAGRLARASSPKGDNTYSYDDRGLLTEAAGPSGDASYAYDADGLLTSRTDAAGTALFTYSRRRLATAQDPLTGAQQAYGYDGSGAVDRIDYGSGQSRSFGYDDLGRLDTDSVRSSTGASVMSADYAYDTDDRMTGKTTTGTADAGSNTYGYDQAGRLTSWTDGSSTTEYRWDDSGNRTGDGSKTATYDERDRLLSDGDYTYGYSARGTLDSRTSAGLTEDFAFDAFDRMTKAGEADTSYTYDSLDRVASRDGIDFTYDGTAPDPVKDNSSTYGRGAADELLSVAQNGPAQLTVSDQHGDVVAGLSPTDGAAAGPAASTAYDPFGQTLSDPSATDVSGNAGFQGDWTDPDTDQVDMGARWYDPGSATFDSQDSYDYASGASILANKYTYGAGDPLDYSDPDGHWPSCGWCKKAKNLGSKALHWAGDKLETGAKYVAKGAVSLWHATTFVVLHPLSALKMATNVLGKAASWAYTHSGLRTVVNAVTSWSSHKAAQAADWAREKAAAAQRQVRAAKAAITRKAKSAAAFVAKHNPIPEILAATKPLMAVVAAVVTANPNLPAIIVSSTRDVVADLSAASEDLRALTVKAIGPVIEPISAAVDYAVKVAPAVLSTAWDVAAEVSGVNDMIDCVTRGDVEACAWSVATVAGFALGGAGAGVVRGLKAGRMGVKAAKYADDIAKAANEADDVEDAVKAVDKAENATQDVTECVASNSFTAGTAVLLADGSLKSIEDVRAGDEVRATDPTTGKTSDRKVTQTITGKGEKHLVRLTVDTDGPKGHATGTITATDGHPFWVPDLKKWEKAGDLKPGEWLRTSSGSWVKVEAVSAWTQKAAVYNLTVDTAHTYYVSAGTTAVLVHNCGTGAISSKQMDEHILPRHDPNHKDAWKWAEKSKFEDWVTPDHIRNWSKLAMKKPMDRMNIGTGNSHRHVLPINSIHPIGYDAEGNALHSIAVWVENGAVDSVHPN